MPFFSLFGGGARDITSFAINGVPATINGTTINLTLPCDGILTDLVASFSTTGERVEVRGVKQVNGVTHNDFSNPVVYTVFSKKGSSKSYSVYVAVANFTEKAITHFSINGVSATFIGNSISLILPYGSELSPLTATFNTTGREVTVESVAQISGETQNDFSHQLTYTVEACDGSTQDYSVTVTVASSDAKAITAFAINGIPAIGIPASIDGATISLTLHCGTDRSHLIATFAADSPNVRLTVRYRRAEKPRTTLAHRKYTLLRQRMVRL